MIAPYTQREIVDIALAKIDREIDRGVNPFRAIQNVAADENVAYEKLEHLYVSRYRKVARDYEYNDREIALD